MMNIAVPVSGSGSEITESGAQGKAREAVNASSSSSFGRGAFHFFGASLPGKGLSD
jgi:hypothetical protein